MDANEGQITRYDSDSGVSFPVRGHQLLMKVTSISVEEDFDEQGKKTGESYILVRLEDVEAHTSWDGNRLSVRDQLTDARLNQRFVVEIRPEDA